MKPLDKLKGWKGEKAVDRIMGCLTILHHHGFLTDRESRKIIQRIQKWINKEAAGKNE